VNPSTVIVENEIEKNGKFPDPEFNCCNLCNLKNLHRAVNTNDHKLLERLVIDKKHIAHLMLGWSVDDSISLLDKILLKGSTELLGALYPNKEWFKDKNYKNDPKYAVRSFYGGSDRVKLKDFLLNKINTGFVSNKAYGVRIR